MPFKLIGVILFAVLIAVLTGFNLGNTTNFWFFHTFPNVSVFPLMIGSFIAGVIVTLPFTFGKKNMQKKLEKMKQELEAKKQEVESKLADKEASSDGAPQNDAENAATEENTATAKDAAAGDDASKKTKKSKFFDKKEKSKK